MARKQLILDGSEYDLDRAIAGLEDIRRYNLQRFEMEQLSAIVFEDPTRSICVGYKDVTEGDFWVRGHMPGKPLMPGVVMCEVAAQLCSYYAQKFDLLGSRAVGFGGMEEVRFRLPVEPPCRFVVVCQMAKVRRNVIITSRFQGLVNGALAVEGLIKGIPLPADFLPRGE